MGRALLNKSLIQLSPDRWGCTPSLVVAWPEGTQTQGWVYGRINGEHQEGLCQGGPSNVHILVVSHCQPMPLLACSFVSVCCGITAPLLWVLVHAKFCLCPSSLESLFPSVLWKACNQILPALKARFSGDSQALCWVPRLRSLPWGSKHSR